jgi:hypothetical protein
MISLPALALLAAEGIVLIRPRWLGISALVAIFVAQLAVYPEYYRYRANYQEWKTATDYIVANERPGDAVVFCVAHGRLLFDYYRDKDHSNKSGELNVAYPDLKNETTDPKALSYFPPLSSEALAATVASNQRVWFVLYPNDWVLGTDRSQQIQSVLASKYPQMKETSEYNVTIRLYSRDGSGSASGAGRVADSGTPRVAANNPEPERAHDPVLTHR